MFLSSHSSLPMEGSVQWEDRIGRRIKLRDVNVLLAVVQSGSMARAAERLAVSQPVVSRAIADLEHTLGVRLLERNRQGIEPTSYGQALLKRGLAAFDELRQGVKDIEFLADPTAGEVRIAATEAMAVGLLPVVISRLYRSIRGSSFTSRPLPAVSRSIANCANAMSSSSSDDCFRGWRRTSLLNPYSTNQCSWGPARKINGCAVARLNFRSCSTNLGSCNRARAQPA